MARSGRLVIIGGHEDKHEDRVILRSVVEQVNRSGSGGLVVATVASEIPERMWTQYDETFRSLGVKHLRHLAIESREDARSPKQLALLENAGGVFFTGGDQLRITTLLGDSPIRDRLHEIYAEGGVIAGTSAGASAMSETMVVGGGAKESARVGATLRLAPGLGFLKDVLIDQHFAERGRVPRMLGAIAQNPRILGLGIDEDTAMIVEQWGRRFRVVGAGAVYVFDATTMSYTNLTEAATDRTLSIFHMRTHVLSQGDRFDLQARRPTEGAAEAVDRALDPDWEAA